MKLFTFLFLIIGLFGCASGPRIPICIFSVDRCEFDCIDRNQKAYVADCHDKSKSDKMIGTTPDGYNQLLQWAKDHNIK